MERAQCAVHQWKRWSGISPFEPQQKCILSPHINLMTHHQRKINTKTPGIDFEPQQPLPHTHFPHKI
jgi:hypothetical protein